jgi:hypothetical protein
VEQQKHADLLIGSILNLKLMKITSIIVGVLVLFTATFTRLNATNETSFDKFDDAAFSWQQTVHDFGKIKKNVPVSYKFSFKNSGDSPLVIASVSASCGCTVTQYSKEPVPPGGEGFVLATYNAANPGAFNKTVTVNANTENPVVLVIKGIVE